MAASAASPPPNSDPSNPDPSNSAPPDSGAPPPHVGGAEISGPLSVGDLLDRIFRLYRARFGVLVLTAAVLLVPIALLNGAVTGQFMVGYLDFLQNLATSPNVAPEDALGTVVGYGGAIFLIAIISGLASGLVNLAISVHGLRFYQGELLSVMEGLRRALPRLWHVVVLYVVQFAALIGIMLVVVTAFVLVIFLVGIVGGTAAATLLQGSDVAGPIAAVGLIVLLLCGYLLMFLIMGLPVLYLMARWVVAVPVLVNEGLGPIASLRRSWQLTQASVWRCVFYLFLLFVLSALVISLPLGVLQQILLLLPIPMQLAFGISTGLSSLFNIVWQPLYAVGMVLLYYDLRVRRESLDVAQRIARLEQETGLAAGVQGVQPAAHE